MTTLEVLEAMAVAGLDSAMMSHVGALHQALNDYRDQAGLDRIGLEDPHPVSTPS